MSKIIFRFPIVGMIDTNMLEERSNTTTVYSNTATSNIATIRSIAIQSNNKIVLGGTFTNYLGSVRNKVVRLDENGTLDTSFNSTGTGFNGTVYVVKIQSNGKYFSWYRLYFIQSHYKT